MRLGTSDIAVLNALLHQQIPEVSSAHRLRLEMLGLVRDTAEGLRLTPAGEKAASGAPTIEHEKLEEPPPRRVDALGRKRMLERTVNYN
jgi:Mn-dependent DtxR family transcriptional regulator